MIDPAPLLALALDAAFGWPEFLYRHIGHPVGLFAQFLNRAAKRGNIASHSFARRRGAGIIAMLILLLLVISTATALEHGAQIWLGAYAPFAIALLAWPGLAQRSLYTHVRDVAQALEQDGLAAARAAVGKICGRDTQALDRHGVARAAIESLAESLSDAVVAPLFWFLIGGLPGLWAYKAINTADSMIGHKDAEWRAFGWAAARADDIANLLPARLSGLLICLAGMGGWRIMWGHASRHASPNSGWPEAAMAGALKLRLAGPATYDGILHHKRWIGQGRSDATPAQLRLALRLYIRSLILLWLLVGAYLWAQ